MGHATELVCMLPRRGARDFYAERKRVVQVVTSTIHAAGAEWSHEPDNLMLHEDGRDGELTPLDYVLDEWETVATEEEGLQRLIDWRTMGNLSCFYAEGIPFSLEFSAYPRRSVRNVVLGVGVSKSLERSEKAMAWFISVGHTLHRELQSTRTFMVWGLNFRGDFDFDEEGERLLRGEIRPFESSYLDLVRT